MISQILLEHEAEVTILLVIAAITAYNAVRIKRSLTRSALLPPKFSSWQFLYNNADENLLLKVTGFEIIKEIFALKTKTSSRIDAKVGVVG